MSVLVKNLRAVLFSNLRPEMPAKLRKAAWDVFNSIASDIDVSGYNEDTMSGTTSEAIEHLDAVMSGNIILNTDLDETLPELIPPTQDAEPRKVFNALDSELDEDEPS